ncbi:hypothetical protein PENNAL_c0239G04899, partial [Penicillium nalgiovense]
NTARTSKPYSACGRYCSQQIHLATSQPIKGTRLRLAGSNVYAKMPPPQQPTELIYCAAPACVPKAKARISTLQ